MRKRLGFLVRFRYCQPAPQGEDGSAGGGLGEECRGGRRGESVRFRFDPPRTRRVRQAFCWKYVRAKSYNSTHIEGVYLRNKKPVFCAGFYISYLTRTIPDPPSLPVPSDTPAPPPPLPVLLWPALWPESLYPPLPPP